MQYERMNEQKQLATKLNAQKTGIPMQTNEEF